MDREAWPAVVHGVAKESDMTEQLNWTESIIILIFLDYNFIKIVFSALLHNFLKPVSFLGVNLFSLITVPLSSAGIKAATFWMLGTPWRISPLCSHSLKERTSLVVQLVKESTCKAEDPGSIPGSGRSSGEGIGYPLQYSWASLVAQLVKNVPAMQETWVWSLGWEDPVKKEMATHCSILAWRIPWTV